MRLLRLAWLLPGIVAVVAAAFIGITYGDGPRWAFGLAILVTIAAVVIDGALKEIRPWVTADVHAVLTGLHAAAGLSDNERICLYQPTLLQRSKVRQVTPYVSTRRYGSGKRGIDKGKGIVGLCFRSGQVLAEVFKDQEDFERNMIEKWGFTREEVGRLQRDRRGYLCVPVLGQDSNTKAVIYLDTSNAEIITDELRDKMQRCALTIAELV